MEMTVAIARCLCLLGSLGCLATFCFRQSYYQGDILRLYFVVYLLKELKKKSFIDNLLIYSDNNNHCHSTFISKCSTIV